MIRHVHSTSFAGQYLLTDFATESCKVQQKQNKGIAFLYTLGEGPCPKSFGVNVARLAGLPDDVLERAKRVSAAFEAEMSGESNQHKIIPSKAEDMVNKIEKLFSHDGEVNHDELKQIWQGLQA